MHFQRGIVFAGLAFTGLALLSGCQSGDPGTRPAGTNSLPTAASAKGGGLVAPLTATATTNITARAPSALPASGRVHSLNPGLRFLVVDYTLGNMPALGSRLNVYRNNEKIGEIKLSGPERNGFVAADIVDGILQVDDEVRTQ